ncbi:carboxylesterase/lipase family protein [Gilvimarinus sp. F26214L]|uniref:carboxylesterase/lipase family protein n=1 Tax=Gilvimarinus sp. DZF01 TaxID=3461371 RepID=UPI004045338F
MNKLNLRSVTALLISATFLVGCGEQSSKSQQTATPTAEAETTSADTGMVGEVVETQWGAVRGDTVSEAGVSARIFRGIPYAAPPVGDLRWQPPQPATAWEGVRDATEWPNRCPQGESSMGAGGPISEDCLYLNVVTTAESASARQPVMVFFHGGGLTSGTGNSTTYNHPKLPSKGVVVVTVNSRLGPIGYLAHPALSAESGHGASGNYGTLDLKASLEWVQANIAAFGGDPDNVTIFGESGGGTKTISQMASPLTEGLFHKAIVQSGSALVSTQRVTMLEDAEATGEKLAAALGIDNPENALEQMRQASWQDLIAAARKPEVGFRANVVVDGYVIPDTVNELFKQGKQHDVPLIVGANEGETSLQTSVPLMANLHSTTASADTYVYNFSHLPKGWRKEEGCVAFHGLELTYVFGAVPTGLTSPTTLYLAGRGGCSQEVPEHDDLDMTVADNTATLWAQFARTGNPSVDGLVNWPAYTEENNRYLEIGSMLGAKTGIESAYVAPPVGE